MPASDYRDEIDYVLRNMSSGTTKDRAYAVLIASHALCANATGYARPTVTDLRLVAEFILNGQRP